MSGERDLEIKLEGRATFLNHAFETYTAVAAALRRGSTDALASKAAVAAQWVARNHDEVGRSLQGAISKTQTSGADGALAHRIRSLPALRTEVASRLEQRLSTTVERAGGLGPLLLTAARRSLLAWSDYERDWQVTQTLSLRIPEGFSVTEVRKNRIAVRWARQWDAPVDEGFMSTDHSGRFEIADGTMVLPSWWFGDRRIRLSSIRTDERPLPHQGSLFIWKTSPSVLSIYGFDTDGGEHALFAIPTFHDAEFVCQVICHFTTARRDSHRRSEPSGFW